MNICLPIAMVLSGLFVPIGCCAQELTAAEKSEFVRQAQQRYYAPVEHGFISMNCDVKIDWDTVPKMMLVPAELAGRERLEETKLRFTMGSDSKLEVTHEYANDTPALMKPVYDKFFEWTSNLVSGFFMTWGAKAMRTPIPDARYIASLTANQDTYQLKFSSGMPIDVTLSRDYVMTRIVTKGSAQTLDEHPQYSPSPQGLLLTGDDAINKTSDSSTHISYDISYQTVDSIEFPQTIHLKVDDNVDMKFALQNCSAEHGTVIQVAPPK